MSGIGGPSRLAGVAIALAFVAGCASGGGASSGGPAVMVTPEMEVAGQQLYTIRCARCHGPNGQNGRFGPNLADDEWLWVQPGSSTLLTDIAGFIRTGTDTPRMPGSTGMPAMGGGSFDDEELNQLAAYILSLQRM